MKATVTFEVHGCRDCILLGKALGALTPYYCEHPDVKEDNISGITEALVHEKFPDFCPLKKQGD